MPTNKIGTLENVCKTLIGLIPFAGAAQNIVKGTKQALQSDGDWAKNQSKVISLLFDIEKNISEVIKSIDVENFGDTQIVSANKTIFFNHTRRTLTEVLAKYQAKALIFHKANAKWQSENPESIGLLQQEIEDDGLMK